MKACVSKWTWMIFANYWRRYRKYDSRESMRLWMLFFAYIQFLYVCAVISIRIQIHLVIFECKSGVFCVSLYILSTTAKFNLHTLHTHEQFGSLEQSPVWDHLIWVLQTKYILLQEARAIEKMIPVSVKLQCHCW